MKSDIKKIQSDYSIKTTSQAFWSLFPALVVANLIPALSGVVNGLIVGNSYSPEAMAAISFASPVSKLIGAVAVIFSSGAGIAYGKYLGRGKTEDVHRVYTSNLIAILAIGVFLTIVCELLAAPIAGLIGAEGDSLNTTTLYLRGLFLGIIPTIYMPSLITFLNLGNEAGYGMRSSVVLAVFNLVLGLINVNVLHWDMFGIGLASSVSQYITLAFLIMKFIKRPELGHIVKPEGFFREIFDMLKFGVPSAIFEIGVAIRNMVINSMTLKTGGTLAVAGLGILNSSAGFICAITPAFIAATATLVSISVGEENRTSLYNLIRFLIKKAAMLFIINGALVIVMAPLIAVLFGAKGEGITIASQCIRIYSVELLTGWFCFVILGTYQSLGRSSLASMLQLLLNCVYSIVIILILVNVLPEDIRVWGVWSNYGISQILGIITIFIISWIKSKHFPNNIERLIWLDKDFGVEEKDRVAISVNNLDMVVQVAGFVQKFLKERNIDSSRSYKTALCLEEMAGNIVSHGFTKTDKKKNLSVDIYVAVKNDDIKIRLKDNAPQFDPFAKLEQYKEDPDDPLKNIGIRMVSKIAKEMKYQTTLGMNVLSIEM